MWLFYISNKNIMIIVVLFFCMGIKYGVIKVWNYLVI